MTGQDQYELRFLCKLVSTDYDWSFAVFFWLFGYFLLWLTSHGHGLSKTGPKTVTGPDLKALMVGAVVMGVIWQMVPHLFFRA
jgi:hypothetical protein